jgi:hypothetical protein
MSIIFLHGFIFAYGVLPFGAQIGLGFGLDFVLY